jgi:hypothetical protein
MTVFGTLLFVSTINLHNLFYDLDAKLHAGDVLFNTLSSFHGHSVAPIQIVKAPTSDRLPYHFDEEMIERLGSSAKPIRQLIKQDIVAARMESNIACEGCTKLGQSSDSRVCSICKLKFGRRIYYCSRLLALTLIA